MFVYTFNIILVVAIVQVASTNGIRIEKRSLVYATLTNTTHHHADHDIDNISESFSDVSFCEAFLGKCIALSVIFGLLILCAAIGNSFVIAAVMLERNLHNVANNLIVSLAVADLMVAIMVWIVYFCRLTGDFAFRDRLFFLPILNS
jgi:hypothetical protein